MNERSAFSFAPAPEVRPVILPGPEPLPPKRRDWRRPAVAVILIGLAYVLARVPAAAPPVTAEFAFVRTTLRAAGRTRISRTVHRDYAPIAGWISSVGAAASLGDLENSGQPDGCVLVDPRTNAVTYWRLSVDPQSGRFVPRVVATFEPPQLPAPSAAAAAPPSAPMGSVIADLRGDGWLDVLVYYWGRLPVLFRNPRGSGAWIGEPLAIGQLGGERTWFTNCVCVADIDGDGRPDLVIGNYFPSTADVLNPSAASPPQEMQESMSNAANGGRKYVLLNHSRPDRIRFDAAPIVLEDAEAAPPAPGQPDRRLDGWTLAIAAADLDGDFLPELYLANDFGPDRLLYNESTRDHVRFRVARATRRYDVPKSKTLGRDSFKGMGVDFAYLARPDLDESPTILVSNIAEPWALLESHFAFVPTAANPEAMRRALAEGVAPYRDRSESLGLARSGWGWDVKAADFNNDGRAEIVQALGFLRGELNKWAYLQELASGNDFNLRYPAIWPYFRTADAAAPATDDPARGGHGAKLSGDSHLAFFARASAHDRFVDIGEQLGFEAKTVSRGIALGDIDHDGREDLILANQWQDSILYRNTAPAAGNYLGIRVLRPAGAKAAAPGVYRAEAFYASHSTGSPVLGARVILEGADHRTVAVGVLDGSNGHSGHRAAELHFGLGTLPRDESLSLHVQWRPPRPEAPPRAPGAKPWTEDGWSSPSDPVHAAAPGSSAGWWVVVVGDP